MRRILGAVTVCLGLTAAFAFGISCYEIPSPDCGFVCGAGGLCPDNYTCATDNICHRDGTPAGTSCVGDGGIDAPDALIVSPHVISMVPADGATGVARTAPISAVVDLPLEDFSVDNSSFIVTSGGVALAGVVAYDDPSRTATFTSDAELPAGALISVQLTGNITSTQGAPLVPAAWSFTTLDDQPPTVASSTPLDMATMVPDATAIAVTFSEVVTGVDTTSFTVSAPGPTPIAGTITGSGATYTFTPAAALPAATAITASFSAAIEDTAGNALVPVAFSFTTQ